MTLISFDLKKHLVCIADFEHVTAYYPVGIYLFNVNNGNTKTMCEICSNLTIKTPERPSMTSLWCLYYQLWTDFTYCSGVCIVDFEQVIAWSNCLRWWWYQIIPFTCKWVLALICLVLGAIFRNLNLRLRRGMVQSHAKVCCKQYIRILSMIILHNSNLL